MGLIKTAPCFVAGSRIEPESASKHVIRSLDGSIEVPAATVSPSQLREAIRYAERSQRLLNRTSLAERTELVKFALREVANYREEIAWALAKFRGLVSKDSHWMCDLLVNWSEQVDELIRAVWGFDYSGSRQIQFKERYMGHLSYMPKGYSALISSSTMDGPPGIAAISHALLAGTHLIVRPSWKDLATHLLFEVLHKHNQGHYAQLVRWPSDDEKTMILNQQLLGNVKQGIVFSSDETFEKLMQDTFGAERVQVAHRIHRYGTGLPLVIVSGSTDLDQAARSIVLGARRGNGKFCLSHSPVLVQKNVYNSLLDKLVSLSSTLKGGDLLNREVDRGLWETEDLRGLNALMSRFGGRSAFGSIGDKSMDLVVLEDVSSSSPCLYQEFPGTLLALIPYENRDEAIQIAQRSLPENHREAWTAVNVFGSDEDYQEFVYDIDAYHFLRGGVTSEPKFLLPHQGRYFAFDLTRRTTVERE